MAWEDGHLVIEIPTVIRVPVTFLGDAMKDLPYLTMRETQTLQLVSADKSNKEIAEALNLSERTVKFHVSSLLAKFKKSGRAGLPRLTGNRNGTSVAADKEQPTCP